MAGAGAPSRCGGPGGGSLMTWKERFAGLVLSAAVVGLAPGEGLAQGYPSRAIRFIAPFPPGSAAEILGRVVGQKLQERWGQSVVVETRPGAGGTIGADLVAKAAPDGYTLLVGSSAEVTVGVSLYAKLPYDPVRDLAPVIIIAPVPNVLVVNPAVPATSVKELVALAKSKPGQLNFPSSRNRTTTPLP